MDKPSEYSSYLKKLYVIKELISELHKFTQDLLIWGEQTSLNKFSLTTASTIHPIYYTCICPALKTLACKGQSGWRAV